MNSLCYAVKYQGINSTKSSSGGAFYILAKYLIEKEKGIVCGASFDASFRVIHTFVDKVNDLYKLQGSKYVQSNIDNCYNQIYEYLKDDKKVIFSGTPCQVNGLYMFLNAKNCRKTENLITIEILCHGVPSPGIFKDYIKSLNTDKRSLSEYNFRSKDKNKNFIIKLTYIDSKIRYKNALLDPYYAAFLSNKILRPSCYNCNFCGKNRKADITIGDFWGIEKIENLYENSKYSSLLLCNSKLGLELFNKVKENISCKEVPYEKGIDKQPQLKNITRKYKIPVDRKNIFEKWRKNSNKEFFKYLKSVSINKKKIIFNILPENVKNIFKRLKK